MSDTDIISQAKRMSIQSLPDAEVSGGFQVLMWLARAGMFLYPWWSPTRDVQLRRFWKEVDYLSGSIYAMESKLTTIPNKVIAKDSNNKNQVAQAEIMTDLLQAGVEFGKGWNAFYGKFIEDLLSQDNGAFSEIIGEGEITGPIIGRAITMNHLDSSRCTRTGDPIYPVIYTNRYGKRYKLHNSRVMFAAQMESPIEEMYGIGFSAVSRCVNVAQSLYDILVFKQEKLGSRPHREIILTKGGLDPQDLANAFTRAEAMMDTQGLTRYSKIVVGGSSAVPDADVRVVELSSLPDGFDEQTAITLGMATIALAFGVDARELFPAMTAGATRADALLQHLKQRGKGPGQILQLTEQLINYKFLPSTLTLTFDFQDDAQDRQVAEIRQIRANKRIQDMATNALDDRVVREQMLEDGELDRRQFERLEIRDGRLPDGTDILSLFFTKKSEISRLLSLGLDNPLDVRHNNREDVLSKIDEKRMGIMEILADDPAPSVKWNALLAEAALKKLELMYLDDKPIEGQENPASKRYIDPRIRKVDLTQPTETDTQPPMTTSILQHADDEPE